MPLGSVAVAVLALFEIELKRAACVLQVANMTFGSFFKKTVHGGQNQPLHALHTALQRTKCSLTSVDLGCAPYDAL